MILKNSSILSIEIVALDRNWIESEMNRNFILSRMMKKKKG